MKDRFFNGFVAGIISGVVPLVINFGCKALGWSTLVWADFMGTFMLGRMPEGTAETIYFAVVQFVFLGVLGAIFALVLPIITSARHLFKGVVFGVPSGISYFLYLIFYSFLILWTSPLTQ